MKPVLIDSNA